MWEARQILQIKVVVKKINALGMIKWGQMVHLGNAEYGVNFAPMKSLVSALKEGMPNRIRTALQTAKDMLDEPVARRDTGLTAPKPGIPHDRQARRSL